MEHGAEGMGLSAEGMAAEGVHLLLGYDFRHHVRRAMLLLAKTLLEVLNLPTLLIQVFK